MFIAIYRTTDRLPFFLTLDSVNFGINVFSPSYWTVPAGDPPSSISNIHEGGADTNHDQDAPTTDPKALDSISPEILSKMAHLDLSRSVIFDEKRVIRAGAYGDVCIGFCTTERRGKVKVAIKRLRFWCREDVKDVRKFTALCPFAPLTPVPALHKRNLCMVKIKASKYSPASWICNRSVN